MSRGVETSSSPTSMASRSFLRAAAASWMVILDAGRRDVTTPSLTRSTSIRGTATTGHCPVGDDGAMTVIRINATTVHESGGEELARRFAERAGAVDSADGFEGFEPLAHIWVSSPGASCAGAGRRVIPAGTLVLTGLAPLGSKETR
jgi:hypothetical protein